MSDLGPSYRKKQHDERMKKWKNVFADAKIFAFAFAGVVAKHVVNVDRQRLELSKLSLAYIGFAIVASFIAVAVMESDGTLAGKKKNWKRRAFTAFMSGVGALALIRDFLG